ncbi:dickkopf-related protein 3-like [Protopterus annectens]|uniref:dickkopf-related protein 3-like n=1 Tax=Protopterus annectens TaxID=7888 RepID=UPI001CFC0040|nr:dickkopf-related protein 3-like [Protopterus annectens]
MILYCCIFSLALINYGSLSPIFHLDSMQDDFPDIKDYFREFDDVIRDKEEESNKGSRNLGTKVDFSKLPPNYHNHTEEEKKVGNRTIYQKKEIHKVTDNTTGDLLMSEKMITSIAEDGVPISETGKRCLLDSHCEKDQYCQSSLMTSQCQECKSKEVACSRDGECCLGYLCVWGKCTEGILRGESGTICRQQENCERGLCCRHQKGLLLPVCSPLPTEGQLCQSSENSLLGLIGWGQLFRVPSGHCPCADGLLCTKTGFGLISTCERAEENTDYKGIAFHQSITRRDKEPEYYDSDVLPEQLQDGSLAVFALPRAVYNDDDSEATDIAQQMGEDMTHAFDEPNSLDQSILEDIEVPTEPSSSEFKELRQLAHEINQYVGPGFY